MKRCGVWWDFPENEPSDGDRVLIHRKGFGNQWEAATYNGHYECWDDIEGDDYMYDLDEIDAIMFVPEIEIEI